MQFPPGKYQISQTKPCVKQHAFLVDQLIFKKMIFVLSRLHFFFDAKKAAQTLKKSTNFSNWAPNHKGAHSEFRMTQKAKPAGHPVLLQTEDVKAHRSKKETQQLTLFEQFAVEGNARAAWLAKDGAMLHGANTGWPASPAPYVSQNSEWLPFWPPFSVGMDSFGRSGGSKFRCGSQISSPFLGLSPPVWGSKNIKV